MLKNLGRITLAGLALCFSLSAFATEVTPEAQIKEVLDAMNQDKSIAKDSKKVRDLIEAKILPNFDFQRMAKLAAGKAWDDASKEQQQALAAEFKTLISRTYTSIMGQYKNEKYTILPMQPADNKGVVKTQVNVAGDEPFSIDYRMGKTADGWKAYDVVIDHSSLVSIYRVSFASEIRQGGFDKLVELLQKKNKEPVSLH